MDSQSHTVDTSGTVPQTHTSLCCPTIIHSRYIRHRQRHSVPHCLLYCFIHDLPHIATRRLCQVFSRATQQCTHNTMKLGYKDDTKNGSTEAIVVCSDVTRRFSIEETLQDEIVNIRKVCKRRGGWSNCRVYGREINIDTKTQLPKVHCYSQRTDTIDSATKSTRSLNPW